MDEWFTRHPDPVAWQVTDLAALGLTAQQCSEAVQFVSRDMEVSGGSDAVARVLIVAGMPYSVAGRIMLLPVMRGAAGAAYRWVARNRHRFRGDSPA